MTRKEKILLLNGLADGTRTVHELSMIHDPVILDEDDTRPIVKIIKTNGSPVILAKDFERLEAKGLIKGFVVDLRNGHFDMMTYG